MRLRNLLTYLLGWIADGSDWAQRERAEPAEKWARVRHADLQRQLRFHGPNVLGIIWGGCLDPHANKTE